MTQSTQIIEELDDCFMRTAGNLMKYYVDEEEQKTKLKQLRDALRDNCIESTKMKTADAIKDRLTSMMELEPERNVEDIVKEYKQAIAEIKIDPSKDIRLVQYDKQMENLDEGNKAESNKGVENTDTDLRMTSQDMNIIDPISKTRMIDPVRNAVCGHVYDRGNLVAMLQRNKQTRCPVVGCTSKDYIDLSQCRVDIVTKMYLEKNPA
ncbi:E3 SUMO-protein ligase NSE2 [Ooceraea biroi]|uniref:E3 SUMO-protein ligase NSE2 n=1 Tax=Ooceraea biroi TaxID=2015173 RepID=A0A026WU87_OOCBI|nr:E3 SUMO-protein ligase NSE2 [Ooceraea biroi]